MTDVRRLDPVRSQMLADMGIEVWVQRDSVDPHSAARAKRPVAQPGAATDIGSAPIPSLATQRALPADTVSSARPRPAPQQTTSAAHAPVAVTCLVSECVVMLIDNAEPGISKRLCRDLLAGVTGNWKSGPLEIAFTWPTGTAEKECWRAFIAFAERQLDEASARYVLCSETLVERLPELSAGCELLALPEFSGLGIDDKRALWRRIQTLKR